MYEILGRNSPRWVVEDKRKCLRQSEQVYTGLERQLLITASPWRSGVEVLIAGCFKVAQCPHRAHPAEYIACGRWIRIYNEDRRGVEIEVGFWLTRTRSGTLPSSGVSTRKPRHSVKRT